MEGVGAWLLFPGVYRLGHLMLSGVFSVKDCATEFDTAMSGWFFGVLTILSPLFLFGFFYGANAIGRNIKAKLSKKGS
jgi:hypothetical protein